MCGSNNKNITAFLPPSVSFIQTKLLYNKSKANVSRNHKIKQRYRWKY